jgi:hypothetical protein
MSEIHNQREIELLEAQLRECRAENAKLLEEAEYELMYGYDMASADYRDIVEQQDREIAKLRAALKPFATALKGNWSHQSDEMPIDAGFGATDLRMQFRLGDFRRARAALEIKTPKDTKDD